jgi:hypothetical protein
MQMLRPIPAMASLPPLYSWPTLLKRIILILAVGACLSAYILMLAGLVGVGILYLLAFNG